MISGYLHKRLAFAVVRAAPTCYARCHRPLFFCPEAAGLLCARSRIPFQSLSRVVLTVSKIDRAPRPVVPVGARTPSQHSEVFTIPATGTSGNQDPAHMLFARPLPGAREMSRWRMNAREALDPAPGALKSRSASPEILASRDFTASAPTRLSFVQHKACAGQGTANVPYANPPIPEGSGGRHIKKTLRRCERAFVKQRTGTTFCA